jgi:hypothetical protein
MGNIFFIGTVVLAFSIASLAVEHKPAKKSEYEKTSNVQPQQVEPAPSAESMVRSHSQTRDILAIPVGGIIGFGLGHVIQNRYSSYRWVYPTIDGITMLIVATNMGDCYPTDQSCKDRQSKMGGLASVLFFGSRLAQIVDLTMFAVHQNYVVSPPQRPWSFAILPDSNSGAHASLTWSF